MFVEKLTDMYHIDEITGMHYLMVAHWHHEPMNNPYHGFLKLACTEHQFNFLLWHEEDAARCQRSDDARIATAKRSIDLYNQQRNDSIEQMDECIADHLVRDQIESTGSLNTETPGSAVDRLSILALRIYHLNEQMQRSDVEPEHRVMVRQKLNRCKLQHEELSQSLKELLADIFSGRKRHRTYRQLKMYNDPTLNPYLYV